MHIKYATSWLWVITFLIFPNIDHQKHFKFCRDCMMLEVINIGTKYKVKLNCSTLSLAHALPSCRAATVQWKTVHDKLVERFEILATYPCCFAEAISVFVDLLSIMWFRWSPDNYLRSYPECFWLLTGTVRKRVHGWCHDWHVSYYT